MVRHERCFKREGLHDKLIAAFRRDAGDTGDEIPDGLHFFGRGRLDNSFCLRPGAFPSHGMIHQNRNGHVFDAALRELDVANHAAGLIGDILSTPHHSAGPRTGPRRRPGKSGRRAGNAGGLAHAAHVLGSL